MNLIQAGTALALGIGVGAVFALARLPVPAPGTLAGVLGVVGLAAGWALVSWLMGGAR